MSSTPASFSTTNVAVETGGVGGTIIGNSTTETVGFHGVTGTAQGAAIADISTSATGTQISVAVNAILAVLKNKGLIA